MEPSNLKYAYTAVLRGLFSALKLPDGTVHPGSILCAMGAVCGAACRRDVRDTWVNGKGLPEDQVFRIIQGKNGDRYYFGDLLDELLISDKYSPVSMAGAACVKAGTKLPDTEDIFRYVTMTAGTERFGIVRSADTGEDVMTWSRSLRKPLMDIAAKYAGPGELHVVMGAALQNLVWQARESMAVREAARIAIESAVFSARLV